MPPKNQKTDRKTKGQQKKRTNPVVPPKAFTTRNAAKKDAKEKTAKKVIVAPEKKKIVPINKKSKPIQKKSKDAGKK